MWQICLPCLKAYRHGLEQLLGEELTLGKVSERRGWCLVDFFERAGFRMGGVRPERGMRARAGDPQQTPHT